MTTTPPRFKGDRLVYQSADLLRDGEKMGAVHDNGYAPRWAFHISPFRWRAENAKYLDQTSDPRSKLYGLLFDGAGFESAEAARAAVEAQLSKFHSLTSEQAP